MVSGRLDTSGVPKVFHDFRPKLARDDLHMKDDDFVVRRFLNVFFFLLTTKVEINNERLYLHSVSTFNHYRFD